VEWIGNQKEVGRESKGSRWVGNKNGVIWMGKYCWGVRWFIFSVLGTREYLKSPLYVRTFFMDNPLFETGRGKERLAGEVKDRTESKLLIESVKDRLQVYKLAREGSGTDSK
jgi:hypothetical protein